MLENWWEEVQAYERIRGCCVLKMHPFLSGRHARAHALGELLDRILDRAGIRPATMSEIAGRLPM